MGDAGEAVPLLDSDGEEELAVARDAVTPSAALGEGATSPAPPPPPASTAPQSQAYASVLPDEAEAPPAYSEPTPLFWSNSRPIGDDFGNEDNAPRPIPLLAMATQGTITTEPRPAGPREVVLTRTASGFGFSIGGSAPVHVVSIEPMSAAALGGLHLQDRILEMNGIDVTESGVDSMISLVQACVNELRLIVVPGPPRHADNAQNRAQEFQQTFDRITAVDPSIPPPRFFLLSLFAFLTCPLIGLGAIYHSMQVMAAWRKRNFTASRFHSVMAQRIAARSILTGTALISLILLVKLGNHNDPNDPNSPGNDPGGGGGGSADGG